MLRTLRVSGPIHTKDTVYVNGQWYFSFAAVVRENTDRVIELGLKIDTKKYFNNRIKTYSSWRKYLEEGVDYIELEQGGQDKRCFVAEHIYKWLVGIVRKKDAASILGISRQTLDKLIREKYITTGLMPGGKTPYIHASGLNSPGLLERIDKGKQLANYKPRTTVAKPSHRKTETIEQKVPEAIKTEDNAAIVTAHKPYSEIFNQMTLVGHIENLNVSARDFQKADREYLNQVELLLKDYIENRTLGSSEKDIVFAKTLYQFNKQTLERIVFSLTKHLALMKLTVQERRMVEQFFYSFRRKLSSTYRDTHTV